jgi:GntR family transcriptional regulator
MYISLDPNSGTPIHLQLAEQTRLAIATGGLRPGDQMPTVRELASRLRINPNTVARVYRDLQAEGLLASRQGSGTFVAEDARRVADAHSLDLLRARWRGAIALARSLGLEWEELRALAEELIAEAQDAGVIGRDDAADDSP